MSVVFGDKCSYRFLSVVFVFSVARAPSLSTPRAWALIALYLAHSLQRLVGRRGRGICEKRQVPRTQIVTRVLARPVPHCVSLSGRFCVSCVFGVRCTCRLVSCVFAFFVAEDVGGHSIRQESGRCHP